jgi:hypothetical protein
VTIAEAKGHDPWYVYLKNTGYSRNAGHAGFQTDSGSHLQSESGRPERTFRGDRGPLRDLSQLHWRSHLV